jgi:hypothetical protein
MAVRLAFSVRVTATPYQWGIESQTGKSYLGIRFNLDGYHSDRQFCDDAWLIVEYYDDTNYENRMAFTRINRDVKIRPSNLPYLEQQYFDPGAGRWVSGAPIFQGRETRYEITMSSKRSKSLIEDALWEDCKRREQNGGAGLPENISQTSREIAEAELAEGPKRLEW